MSLVASLPYGNLAPREWEGAVRRARDLGIRHLLLPVSWGRHEQEEGRPRFDGPLDLPAFVDLAKEHDLSVRLALGPHIGNREPGLGLPEWLLNKESLWMRSKSASPYFCPAPPRLIPGVSLLSSEFGTHFDNWLESVASALDQRLGDAAIAEVIIDWGFPCHDALGPGLLDHHPDAEKWMKGEIEGMQPFGGDDSLLALHLRERYSHACMDALGRSFHRSRFAKTPLRMSASTASAHLVSPQIDKLLWVHPLDGLGLGRRDRSPARRVLAQSDVLATVSLGQAPWFPPARKEPTSKRVSETLAQGASGLVLTGLFETQSWVSSHVADNGWIGRLTEALEGGAEEVARARAERELPKQVALIDTRVEERYASLHSALPELPHLLLPYLGARSPSELSYDEESRLYSELIESFEAALDLASLNFIRVEESALHALPVDVSAVVLPTLHRVDGATWAGLHALAATGVQVVVGPATPLFDERGRPLGPDRALPEGCALVSEELAGHREELAASFLAVAAPQTDDWIAGQDPKVRVNLWTHAESLWLSLSNLDDEQTETRFNVPTGIRLWDLVSGETFAGNQGVAIIAMQGHSSRIFIAKREEVPRA